MARNLNTEGTDGEAERRLATLTPYKSVSVTVTAARPAVRLPDGGTEATEPDVKTSSQVVPGREGMENSAEYERRVQEFKKRQPNFSQLVDQSAEIPRTAYDQILRMRNGPEIALFLSFSPDMRSNLFKMDPVEAAEAIEDMSSDLDWGNMPTDRIGYSVWKEARNREKAPRARKR